MIISTTNKEDISVYTLDGAEGVPKTKTPIEKYGDDLTIFYPWFVIHPDRGKNYFAITHIPTGKFIRHETTKRKAIKRTLMLMETGVDWSKTDEAEFDEDERAIIKAELSREV